MMLHRIAFIVMNSRAGTGVLVHSLFLLLAGNLSAQAPQVEVKISFRVKYVAEGAAYLEGGTNEGLAIGQRLSVKRDELKGAKVIEQIIAELQVISVASSSAACAIVPATAEVRPDDIAFLSPNDISKLQVLRASRESRKYAQVVSFSEGDPLDEEVRENVPRPPLPEVNRLRGRIGFEYNSICDLEASGDGSSQLGLVLRADMSRIGATYWNFEGYYRGRLNSRSRSAGQQTLTDLVNRTYHLSLTYNNPRSRWVAGFGRLYLPWASSLSTIDGGYFGRRFGKGTTLGVFGGSAPDPTSWNYDPNRQMSGAFINFEGGSFESFRYTSTVGAALTRVRWRPERQFGFFENSFFYKHYLSIYHNLEADLMNNSTPAETSGLTASRSYLTVRVQPNKIIAFDISHNYFRNLPTFDPRLVSTGLIDKLLFQGISGGVRLELPYRLSIYSSLGRSSRTGDVRDSWNQMYGIAMARIWRTGIRGDFRYSTFNSSFASGSYRSLTFTREIGDSIRFDVQAGQQNLLSALTGDNRARWINSNLDWMVLAHYFLGAGFTVYRGQIQSYNQWYLNLGYRF